MMQKRMIEDLASIAARILANEHQGTEIEGEVRTAQGDIILIHPVLNLIPLMNQVEMKGLVRSIKKHGLRMALADLAERIRDKHELACAAAKLSIECGMDAGDLLNEAKAKRGSLLCAMAGRAAL